MTKWWDDENKTMLANGGQEWRLWEEDGFHAERQLHADRREPIEIIHPEWDSPIIFRGWEERMLPHPNNNRLWWRPAPSDYPVTSTGQDLSSFTISGMSFTTERLHAMNELATAMNEWLDVIEDGERSGWIVSIPHPIINRDVIRKAGR